MKRIAVVSVGRSDYGLYLPILRRLAQEPDAEVVVVATGAHCSPQFGLTAKRIEHDGWTVVRVEMFAGCDTPEAIAESMGRGVIGLSQAYARLAPDLVVVLGDRFEMHAAAVAAVPLRLPLLHIHGGELTEGAMDDALRHSITKLSHLHCVATEESRRRVIQMGEEPWRVTVTGAPALDHLRTLRVMGREDLAAMGLPVDAPPLLVTFHPVTLEDQAEAHTAELIQGLSAVDHPIIVTAPNADTRHSVVRRALQAWAASRPRTVFVENLGTDVYFSVMAIAAAMVGNSSSGIIEAPSFELPVVNVGSRQGGRLRAGNVIDVEPIASEIRGGLRRALDPAFRERLRGLVNPYGDGHAAERIVRVMTDAPLGDCLIRKRFIDQSALYPEPASVMTAGVSQ
jgi:UDP-hydrolysing UDP-N-acetyl-D-glucosamine 2-epimerase